MSGQLRAFDPGPATGAMTDLQQLALDHLTANPAGVRSSDLGAYLHQAMTKRCACTADVGACKWAMSEGERVGKQLRKRGLAVKRKATGRWQLTHPPITGINPSTAPFPEGF